MKSIIQQFTNDSWFRRGKLVVHSFRSYLVDGEYVKEETSVKTYTRKFFIHTASDKDIKNAGLSEITDHTIIVHLEFPLKFSDGKPVQYALEDGSTVEGVTVSDEIEYQGYRYKLMYHGPWSEWRHYYYIAQKINQEQQTVC